MIESKVSERAQSDAKHSQQETGRTGIGKSGTSTDEETLRAKLGAVSRGCRGELRMNSRLTVPIPPPIPMKVMCLAVSPRCVVPTPDPSRITRTSLSPRASPFSALDPILKSSEDLRSGVEAPE